MPDKRCGGIGRSLAGPPTVALSQVLTFLWFDFLNRFSCNKALSRLTVAMHMLSVSGRLAEAKLLKFPAAQVVLHALQLDLPVAQLQLGKL